MNNILDGNAQLDVEISNLRATDEELETLKGYIVRGLGKNCTPPIINTDGIDTKGPRYIVTFKVLDPRNFKIDTVKDWLHAAILVGWRLEATFVPRQ
jgi:hypothetical protein